MFLTMCTSSSSSERVNPDDESAPRKRSRCRSIARSFFSTFFCFLTALRELEVYRKKTKQYFKKSPKILLKASQADELPEIDVLVLSRSKMTRTHVTLFRFRTKVQTNCLRRANDSARAIHQNSSISSKLS